MKKTLQNIILAGSVALVSALSYGTYSYVSNENPEKRKNDNSKKICKEMSEEDKEEATGLIREEVSKREREGREELDEVALQSFLESLGKTKLGPLSVLADGLARSGRLTPSSKNEGYTYQKWMMDHPDEPNETIVEFDGTFFRTNKGYKTLSELDEIYFKTNEVYERLSEKDKAKVDRIIAGEITKEQRERYEEWDKSFPWDLISTKGSISKGNAIFILKTEKYFPTLEDFKRVLGDRYIPKKENELREYWKRESPENRRSLYELYSNPERLLRKTKEESDIKLDIKLDKDISHIPKKEILETEEIILKNLPWRIFKPDDENFSESDEFNYELSYEIGKRIPKGPFRIF